MLNEEDKLEFARLKDAIAEAKRQLSKWLNSKVEQYAKFKIGDEVYEMEHGTLVGIIDRIEWEVETNDTALLYKVKSVVGIPETIRTKTIPAWEFEDYRYEHFPSGIKLPLYGTKEDFARCLKVRRQVLEMKINEENSKAYAQKAKLALDKIRQSGVDHQQ